MKTTSKHANSQFPAILPKSKPADLRLNTAHELEGEKWAKILAPRGPTNSYARDDEVKCYEIKHKKWNAIIEPSPNNQESFIMKLNFSHPVRSLSRCWSSTVILNRHANSRTECGVEFSALLKL